LLGRRLQDWLADDTSESDDPAGGDTPMLILAGQGNPGDKYAKNRHNLGFMALDEIARAYDFGPWKVRFGGQTAEGFITGDGVRVKALLIKPATFYNETGRSVGEAARFYKLGPEDIVVFHDEIDLAPGRLRVKTGGGHSGNNGIRSLIQHLGNDFRRVRMGVGHPGDKSKVMPYVLADFPKAEQPWRDDLLDACARALPYLASGDDERYQTDVMRRAPAPKSDPKQKG